MIQSKSIEKIVHFALENGNEILEISEGWTKVNQVVHMRGPLSKEVHEFAAREGLRHWTTDQTPHNRGEQGFTDDTEKVAISFPRVWLPGRG